MSKYAQEFTYLHNMLVKRRKYVLETIVAYLGQNKLQELAEFMSKADVLEVMMPPELAYIRGLFNRHFGPDATEKAPDKKLPN